jgi:hypothetical protein
MNVPDFRPPPGPAVAAQAAALREAFPHYTVNVIEHHGEPARYEVISRDGRNPYCLISTDAREIWHELKAAEPRRPPR